MKKKILILALVAFLLLSGFFIKVNYENETNRSKAYLLDLFDELLLENDLTVQPWTVIYYSKATSSNILASSNSKTEYFIDEGNKLEGACLNEICQEFSDNNLDVDKIEQNVYSYIENGFNYIMQARQFIESNEIEMDNSILTYKINNVDINDKDNVSKYNITIHKLNSKIVFESDKYILIIIHDYQDHI